MRSVVHGTPGFWGAAERSPRVSARACQTCPEHMLVLLGAAPSCS